METTNVPHSTSSAVDYGHIPAIQMRAEAAREILRDIVSVLLRKARQAYQAYLEYRQRRAAYRELVTLDVRTLHDIGVSHSDIDAMASDRISNDGSRCRKHVEVSSNVAATIIPWRERPRPGIRTGIVSPCAK